ncbi:MAG: serine/threonine-protein kinase [Acidobacteriota bacterium]
MSRRSDPKLLREIFDRAMTLPPAEREPYVRQACGGDAGLYGDVSSLLETMQRRPAFLEDAGQVRAAPAPDAPASQGPPPLQPGTRVADYEIERQLGEGGMGTVYRARDTKLDRLVALKFLRSGKDDEETRARFLREAKAACRLDHGNVGTVYGVGEHEGHPYIAMAYYDGETLHERIKRGPMALPAIADVVRQIVAGLGAAHDAGVVHRDLKPPNVMITPSGQVKLLDFGLAKVASRTGSTSRLTDTGVVMGTMAYMSPEQARGERVDARADVWALGVIAYEMLTAVSPFDAGSAAATLTRILKGAPEPLEKLRADVPPAMRSWVEHLLEKDRERRPANVRRALELFESGVPIVRPGPRPRRRATVAFAAACVILGGLATAFVVSRRVPRDAHLRVALLPCQVFASDDAAFLADAIPTRLWESFRGVPGFDAVPAPPSSQWDPRTSDLASAASALDAASCITCTISGTIDRYTLGVQLVTPATRAVSWSSQLPGTKSTYLETTDKAAVEIRNALLPGGPAPAVSPKRKSDVALALDRASYLVGRYETSGEDRDRAAAALQDVARREPRSASVLAEEARLALAEIAHSAPGAIDELSRRAADLATGAIAQDRSSARAWTCLGLAHLHGADGHTPAALVEILHGAALAPGNRDSVGAAARVLSWRSRALARAYVAAVLKEDPFDATPYAILGQVEDDVDAGLAAVERGTKLLPVRSPELALARSLLLARAGRTGATVDAAAIGEREPYAAAVLHAASERTGDALAALDDAKAAGRLPGDFDRDPVFARIRSDPQFIALAAAVRPTLADTLETVRRALDAGEAPVHLRGALASSASASP